MTGPSTFTVVSAAGAAECVVKAVGEANVRTAAGFIGALRSAMEEHPAGIVVDLADLSELDMVGLYVLLSAASRSKVAGMAFAVADPGPSIRQVLVLNGADESLNVVPQLAGKPSAEASQRPHRRRWRRLFRRCPAGRGGPWPTAHRSGV